MSITPNHAATAALPKALRTILFWASSIAGAVVLWQLEPAQDGSLVYRSLVIVIVMFTVVTFWALGWLLLSKMTRRHSSRHSRPIYPTDRPIG